MTEEATTPEPAPITADNVVSEPEAPAAPDSTILSQKLNSLLQREQQEPQSEYARLQQAMDLLEQRTRPPEPKPKQPDYSSELDELRKQHEELRNELATRTEQQELMQASKDVSGWVSQNSEHFPLINEAGYQAVVFQKIMNVREETGRVIDAGQAAREVESELSDLIRRLAPRMGYYTREEEEARREEAEISATTAGLDVSVPVNWDSMSDDEQMDYLVKQIERR